MTPSPSDRALAADYERLRLQPRTPAFQVVALRMRVRLRADGPLTVGDWSYSWSHSESSVFRYPARRIARAKAIRPDGPPVVHTYCLPQAKEVA